MGRKVPVLLSFYGLSNGVNTMLLGQVGYTKMSDLSFKKFGRRKTFRTLFRLYRTKPCANQSLTFVFQNQDIQINTNSYGAFYEKNLPFTTSNLKRIIMQDGREVAFLEDLFEPHVSHIREPTIVISDIDDTLLHSFISRKLRKFRTMMFTTMEKRKAVAHMKELMTNLVTDGAAAVYVSNSEQNLYPLIYRFLKHNAFPDGPVFLKQLRSLWDLIRNVKFPVKNIHKTATLKDLIAFFPSHRFVLMGDNTQQDLNIYLSIAEQYPQNVACVVIRKVVERKKDYPLVTATEEKLKRLGVRFYYGESFPTQILVGR